MKHKKCFTAIALCMITGVSAFAQELPKGAIIFTPAKAKWAPSATPGGVTAVEQAMIVGHPAKSGPYVYHAKFLQTS